MSFEITIQPDDITCGPTCLHAVYHYHGYWSEIGDLLRDVEFLEEGGTLSVLLGIDALRRGFNACIYSYNLFIFDPTWSVLDKNALIEKLHQQLRYKSTHKIRITSEAYIRFLELGGKVLFSDLTPDLLRRYLDQELPIIAGLSATYLYRDRREIVTSTRQTDWDDVKGEPTGHFVVLYEFLENRIRVADPSREHPFEHGQLYEVDLFRLINSIMLGIATYDANLLIVSPKSLS